MTASYLRPLINSYTTGLAPSVLTYILETLVTKKHGGRTESQELGLPVTNTGLALPCGATGAQHSHKGPWIDLHAQPVQHSLGDGLLRGIGEADNQIVANVVEEDCAFGPENLGVEPREIRQRVDDALKAVGMYLPAE